MPSWVLPVRFLYLLTALINRRTRTRLRFAVVRFDLLSKILPHPCTLLRDSVSDVRAVFELLLRAAYTRTMVRGGTGQAAPHTYTCHQLCDIGCFLASEDF